MIHTFIGRVGGDNLWEASGRGREIMNDMGRILNYHFTHLAKGVRIRDPMI